MQLVWPAPRYLAGYVAALKRGWSANNVRPEAAVREELEAIAAGAGAFLDSLIDRDALGPPIPLPDGSTVPRLPGVRGWIWDGEFCGSINLRWQKGTPLLPPHVLGHVGYAVVPWKRGLGAATVGLREMLKVAWDEGLPYVELTTDPANIASQRVIEKNAGYLVEHFEKPAQYGGAPGVRYRVDRPAA